MYPFTTETTMVRNRWYLAGFSDEITREPMERTILGEPVVFYRTEAGDPVAMYGICPNRYFPLAQGELKGDSIACGYHGFTFDQEGNCIDVPSQDGTVNFCQPTYTIEERDKLCWIWMGDDDARDVSLIPPHEHFGQGQDDWHDSSYNYFHIEGRAQLLIDNLMDLTHLPYVHSHLPGGEHLAKTQNRMDDSGEVFMLYRDSKSPHNPFFTALYGPESHFEGLAEIENQTAFYGPELIRTGIGRFVDVNGDPEAVPEAIGLLYILHAITPETEYSTHYFGWAVRNFRLGDPALDNMWLESDNVIRGQDAEAIKAIEARLEQSAKRQKELLVKSDAPAVRVRRNVQAMLHAEAN